MYHAVEDISPKGLEICEFKEGCISQVFNDCFIRERVVVLVKGLKEAGGGGWGMDEMKWRKLCTCVCNIYKGTFGCLMCV